MIPSLSLGVDVLGGLLAFCLGGEEGGGGRAVG